jgi:hypothetical protein
VLGNETESSFHVTLVLLLVLDELVRGSDDDVGMWTLFGDDYRSPCYSRKGTSSEGFFQDVNVIDLRKLLVDERQVLDIGGDVYVFRVDEA